MTRLGPLCAAACALCGAGSIRAQPLGTAFTYQGDLQSAGQPVSGVYDFEFRLFNAGSGGVQQGATLCADNVTVTDGRFTVRLDFGPQFGGQARFLEIRVRADTGLTCGNATGYTLLAPRQEATPAPNAVFASAAAAAATATTAADAAALGGQAPAFYTNAGNLTAGTLPSGRLGGTYSGLLTFSNAGNTFTGAGGGLTGLNASNIGAGTLSDARLSPNVALLGAAQTFAGANTFSNALNSFTGSGAGLTNLDASDLATGTLPNARLSGTYSSALALSNPANSFTGSGAGLTGLNASNLAAGTLPDGRLAGTYTGALTFSNALNSFTGSGAGLTNLDASDLATGTLPNARLSGTYSSALAFSNAANTYSGVGTNLTSLNASNLSTGFVPDGRLSANVARTSSANTFSGNNTFSGLNDFTNTTEFVFGARTLQVRNDGGLVPGLNLTGTSGNVGILRLRNALEIWPDDALTRAARLDLRDTTPAVRIALSAADGTGVFAGELVVDNALVNSGGLAPGLRFGETFSGEGVASTRAAGPNRWGLDLYTASAPRLSITNAGNVGIGTQTPAEKLTVAGNVSARNLAAVKGVQTFSESRGTPRGQMTQGDSRDLDAISVSVPANGTLMIFATATVDIDTTAMVGAKAAMELKLDDTGPGGGLMTNTRFTCRSGDYDGSTLTIVWSVPVTGGTTRSFKTSLYLYRVFGSGNCSGHYWTSSLHAVFVPNTLP